jgi:hypothetical protein
MSDTLYTLYAGSVVHRYSDPQLDDQPAIIADVVGQAETPAAMPPARAAQPTSSEVTP